ncbi:thiol-disulfide oxidoreductase ResA [Rossellomorea vietnamensis]|uniref:Thiol-disulfide oxidoreductase ResA n=1 Tax=Rossellomorea vietnamensis TaxID=218284 RepID=A0A5D4NXG6_9BACI|nr:thiol-disulfide oxidoreductase ResA [Rossellomorea vietnamensis]TYS18987.1 thiol-disulfide oxidoreductase ResA [Rossellomorea vietnamensis]
MDKKKRRLLIRTIILVVLAAAVIYTLYANFTKEDRGVLKAGDQAPDFVLQDMEGNTHQLSDYKGQGVFLNFWGTWCKPCEKEMPYMENQYQAFKDKGVQILAVNVGESDFQVNKFIAEHDLTFPVVVDSEIDVQNAYGIKPLPTTLLVDENGIIQRIITGEMTETDIEQHMESIKPN